jgi:predicted DNA-binding transcriptional regulator AlpA
MVLVVAVSTTEEARMSLEHAPEERQVLITRRAARKRAGDLSRTTEHRLLKDPGSGWPRPVQITRGLSGYLTAEIDSFIAKRLAERDRDVK